MALQGVLYFGLNLDPYDNLDVFEINVRHGDPEWEVLARKLSSDLLRSAWLCGMGLLTRSSKSGTSNTTSMSLPWKTVKSSEGLEQGVPGAIRERTQDRRVGRHQQGNCHLFCGRGPRSRKGTGHSRRQGAPRDRRRRYLGRSPDKAYRNIKKIAFLDHYNNNANCMRFRETIGL